MTPEATMTAVFIALGSILFNVTIGIILAQS